MGITSITEIDDDGTETTTTIKTDRDKRQEKINNVSSGEKFFDLLRYQIYAAPAYALIFTSLAITLALDLINLNKKAKTLSGQYPACEYNKSFLKFTCPNNTTLTNQLNTEMDASKKPYSYAFGIESALLLLTAVISVILSVRAIRSMRQTTPLVSVKKPSCWTKFFSSCLPESEQSENVNSDIENQKLLTLEPAQSLQYGALSLN